MKMTALLAALLMLFSLPGRAEIYLSEPPADWEGRTLLRWTVFDVNEGDAMLLECGGESMLVDGGSEPFRDQLREALEARGLRNGLAYILNTHYHDDHLGGIYHLFRAGFTPGKYLHPYTESEAQKNTLSRKTVEAVKKNRVSVRLVQHGDVFTLGQAQLHVYRCTEIGGVNAQSLVIRVSFGESSMLLCADINGKVQHYFAQHLPADALRADLIKMPHHAITPAVPAFLDAVSPGAAIVTNRQKDLDSKSITQLEGRNLPALYSGDGTVYAVTDGADWYLCQTEGEF